METYVHTDCIALMDQTDRQLELHLTSGRVLIVTQANEQIEQFKNAILAANGHGGRLIRIPEMVSFRTVSAAEFKDFVPSEEEQKLMRQYRPEEQDT